jgi:imidazolonepropionase-like amidohydrolase
VHAPLATDTVVITDVVLSAAEDAKHVDITIRAGRIAAIAPTGGELPAGARTFEGLGMLAQPGFVDPWTTSGVEAPAPVIDQDEAVETRSDVRAAMRTANRKGIAPSFRASGVVDFGADGAGAWRSSGFGAVLAAPSGDLLAGHGVLCVTRAGSRRELILNPEVFQFGAFEARGGGFPSTTMGYFAQLRQFFYDSTRQAELERRFADGAADPRPAFDAELTAGAKLAAGRELYVVEANRADDIERWVRLADEFGLRIAISGGREAWRRAELLKARGIPVLLDMDLGDEVDDPMEEEPEEELIDGPDDEEAAPDSQPVENEVEEEAAGEEEDEAKWHYDEPEALKAERRRLWEERRDNAKALFGAGVRVLFATGDRKPKELMADLHKALDAGLDRETVRRALTGDAARFLGLADHLGELAVGHDANFGIWTADPLGDDASLAMMVVDGRVDEYDVKAPGEGPDEGIDGSGTWTITVDSEEAPQDSTLELEMNDDGVITGSLSITSPMDGEPLTTSIKGDVSGSTMSLKGTIEMGGMEIGVQIEVDLKGDAFSGTSTWSGPWGEDSSNITGTRPPTPKRTHEDETETHYSCND